MSRIITCPSGLSGKVRGFRVKEASLLANKAQLMKGTAFDGILSGCWLETTDAGPYPWLQEKLASNYGGPPDWSKVLVCDRFWTLLQIRGATYGDTYAFKVKCQNDMCGKTIDWELDLNDLPVKALPEASRAQLKTENKFETTLDDGKKCWFRLQTGAGEQSVAKLLKGNQEQALMLALANRIVDIEGLDQKAKLSYLENMEMGELMRLVSIFDEADGGTETELDVECGHCEMVQAVNLPLGRDFFLPKTTVKTGQTPSLK